VPAGAVTFLLAQQCPGGAFRLFYDATAPAVSTRGCASDAEADTDATAFAITALVTTAATAERSAAVTRATTWLLDHQDPATGGFGGTGPTAGPNANTTALAVRALRAVGQTAAVARALDFVATMQLDSTKVTGTPATGEVGAIARNQAALTDALASGMAPSARDQWRRATTQAVLALATAPFGAARADVVALAPARLLDTRPGETTIDGNQLGAGPTNPGTVLTLPVAGRGGVPTDATAVVLNITAVNATGPGYITVYACDTPRPLASNLNYLTTNPTPNAVITKLSATGTICLYTSANNVDLITDVNGYFG
jgi:hypothetical protein